MSLLDVEGLRVEFDTMRGVVPAVRGVSYAVEAGETLGIVGETGCGKSVTASCVLGLLPSPPARITATRLAFDGTDMLVGGRLSYPAAGRIRGRGISMIFQDPSSALNPVFPIGDPLCALLRTHFGLVGAAARDKAVSWLGRVGLPSPAAVMSKYPHELSGGMKQRVAIAMALACEPKLVIADEPTTALDVTIQAQVLDLLAALQAETGIGLIFISHDLGVVRKMCHRVMVMYAGQVVESATREQLFTRPRHPYTRGLFAARPTLRGHAEMPVPGVGATGRAPLAAIRGSVPRLADLPPGCAFAPRCSRADERCGVDAPRLEEGVACWHPGESA
jgi:oligopeptide/dipeptide ABC transporter ATP-binding protein